MQVKTGSDVYAPRLKGYDSKQRFVTYWHQVNEAIQLDPSSILEVGVGTRFVCSYMKRLGYAVTTLDLLRDLRPGVAGSVLTLPFAEDSFDVGICCQVLEHLPFDCFKTALAQLHRVCRSKLILSLPDASRYFGVALTSPVSLPPVLVSLPTLFTPEHVFDGYHFWEIGKKGYPKTNKPCLA
ncbi:MAG: class I SAM-dependent methyltransferase [Candidatus Bathyarchaeota archaeon]|nr:class I SAM-dependent methyltransferase [Candidatus Bathyarchaeota archaeon]